MSNEVTAYVIEGSYASEDIDDEFDFEDKLQADFNADTWETDYAPGFSFRIQLVDGELAEEFFEAIVEAASGELLIRLTKHVIETIAEYDGDNQIDIE